MHWFGGCPSDDLHEALVKLTKRVDDVEKLWETVKLAEAAREAVAREQTAALRDLLNKNRMAIARSGIGQAPDSDFEAIMKARNGVR